MNTILESIQYNISSHEGIIKRYQAIIPIIEELCLPDTEDYSYSTGPEQVDLDNPTREQFTAIRACFPPGTKWTRNANYTGEAIDYSTVYKGITFRCYHTPPPSSCKVEYEEVFVPGHIEKKAKLVCGLADPED